MGDRLAQEFSHLRESLPHPGSLAERMRAAEDMESLRNIHHPQSSIQCPNISSTENIPRSSHDQPDSACASKPQGTQVTTQKPTECTDGRSQQRKEPASVMTIKEEETLPERSEQRAGGCSESSDQSARTSSMSPNTLKELSESPISPSQESNESTSSKLSPMSSSQRSEGEATTTNSGGGLSGDMSDENRARRSESTREWVQVQQHRTFDCVKQQQPGNNPSHSDILAAEQPPRHTAERECAEQRRE